MPSKRLSSKDPAGEFEPPWAKVFLAIWLAALVIVAVMHHSWPKTLGHSGVLTFATYWILSFFGIGGIVAAIAAVRRRQVARAERERLCLNCGYDLRATPERCPECGAEQPTS